MKTFYRYIRAFWLALKMTLRGEKPPQLPKPPLVAWFEQSVILTDTVYKIAEANALDKSARQMTKLRLDGRQMSLETVLATIKFHAAQEYAMLARGGLSQQVINTIYASNVNDLYWVTRLVELETPPNPAVQIALLQLKTHLQNFPLTEA